MSNITSKLRTKLYIFFLKTPILNRSSKRWYRKLGVKLAENSRIYRGLTVLGSYSNIELGKNAEITTGCFLLAKDKIIIGENSTLAYKTIVLTSANPNGPYNKLINVYPKYKAPVIIGHDSWVGAGAILLPGITIGNFCVVAAGAVVTKDVPDYTVVAGVPAKPVKKLDQNLFK